MNVTKFILFFLLAMVSTESVPSAQAKTFFIPPGKLIKDSGDVFKATKLFGPLILKEGLVDVYAPLPLDPTCSVDDVVDSRFVEPQEFLRWLLKRMSQEQKAFVFDSNSSPLSELRVITHSTIVIKKISENEADGSVTLDTWRYTFHLAGQWNGDTFTAQGSEWTEESLDHGPETVLFTADCQ